MTGGVTGVEWDRSGEHWSGVEWGWGWSGVEWSAVQCSAVSQEWSELEWSVVGYLRQLCYVHVYVTFEADRILHICCHSALPHQQVVASPGCLQCAVPGL